MQESLRRIKLWFREEVMGRVVVRATLPLEICAYVWRRLLWRTTFIAITGSVGKTTTKEMLAHVLGHKRRTFRSLANQNHGLMIPLNILRVRPWHRYAILETAASEVGSLDRVPRILKPDMAVHLGMWVSHPGGFADLDEHAAEKEKLFSGLTSGNKAFLNGDDPRVVAMRCQASQILFGTSSGCHLRVVQTEGDWPDRFALRVSRGDSSDVSPWIRTQVVGRQWLPSVAAVVAIASELGWSSEEIGTALSRKAPFPARMQPVRLPGGAMLLRDEYHGSSTTLEAALDVMREARVSGQRLLVIGDISCLPGHSRERLKYLARVVPGAVDRVVLMGERRAYGVRRLIEAGFDPADCLAFSSLQEAAQALPGMVGEGDLILLKGRTTEHVSRLYHAMLGPILCWKKSCSKTMLCDECWELGATPTRGAPVEIDSR